MQLNLYIARTIRGLDSLPAICNKMFPSVRNPHIKTNTKLNHKQLLYLAREICLYIAASFQQLSDHSDSIDFMAVLSTIARQLRDLSDAIDVERKLSRVYYHLLIESLASTIAANAETASLPTLLLERQSILAGVVNILNRDVMNRSGTKQIVAWRLLGVLLFMGNNGTQLGLVNTITDNVTSPDNGAGAAKLDNELEQVFI